MLSNSDNCGHLSLISELRGNVSSVCLLMLFWVEKTYNYIKKGKLFLFSLHFFTYSRYLLKINKQHRLVKVPDQ